jgi:PAP2 superfamily
MKSVLKLPAAALLAGTVGAALAVATARADVVTDWNVTANEVMTTENVGNNPRLRTLAMVHVAMSDAINSVQARYARVVATVPAVPNASPEAAASAAARQILNQLYPKRKEKIDAVYVASLKGIPDGPARTGIALGEQVAAAVQADRADDGTNAPDTYRPFTSPGVYVPTTPPVFAQYARAKPWVVAKADQFRPGPPPDLSSAAWASDYNEVKALGGTTSTARTPDQTAAVHFWRNANFGPSWQAAARQLSIAKELGLHECARLFALLNMGLANAYILNWDAKYTYNFWRPVTAIRNGDVDGNDDTEHDAGWTPLNTTPMHPEYPSQATINATVASDILASVFGPGPIPFTAIDIADPKHTRHFNSLAEMVEEQKNVRVWGGVHYRSAIHAGKDMGHKSAAWLIANTLRPAP